MPLVSLREFARQHGWNPGYVHKLKKRGILVMRIDENGKELVDVDASNAAIAAAKDPAKEYMQEVNQQQRQHHRGEHRGDLSGENTQTIKTSSSNATYHQAKTAREVYQAKLAQLDYEKKIGKLIEVDAVKAVLTKRILEIRDSIMLVPARLAPILAAESSQKKIQQIVSDELRRILEQLASLSVNKSSP